MSYVTGFLLAVPTARREAYRRMCEAAWPVFREHGALLTQENWGVDVPDGQQTSFAMATRRTSDETVVFSWMVWPDRETADRAWAAVQEDPRLAALDMPFDGSRIMWGGFEPLVVLAADDAGTGA